VSTSSENPTGPVRFFVMINRDGKILVIRDPRADPKIAPVNINAKKNPIFDLSKVMPVSSSNYVQRISRGLFVKLLKLHFRYKFYWYSSSSMHYSVLLVSNHQVINLRRKECKNYYFFSQRGC
jgi:hypothetical protein